MHLIAEAEGKCIPISCAPPLPSQATNCRGEGTGHSEQSYHLEDALDLPLPPHLPGAGSG